MEGRWSRAADSSFPGFPVRTPSRSFRFFLEFLICKACGSEAGPPCPKKRTSKARKAPASLQRLSPLTRARWRFFRINGSLSFPSASCSPRRQHSTSPPSASPSVSPPVSLRDALPPAPGFLPTPDKQSSWYETHPETLDPHRTERRCGAARMERGTRTLS